MLRPSPPLRPAPSPSTDPRAIRGAAHLVAERKLWRGNLSGLAVSARNVIVQTTEYTYDIVPHSGKITEGNPDVFGQGTAVSMPAGRVLGGSWSLTGPKAATGYVDAQKKAVPFMAGSTWVIYVPKGTRVR